jgi:methylase of polypeptide subunit release factors
LSLARQVQPQQAQNIVATSYDSEAEVTSKYNAARNNISELRNRQVQVLHQIDATQIDPSLGPFSSIVFNFPFVEGPRGAQQVERNAQMIQKFFLSAVNALEDGGKIFMTTKQHWLARFTPEFLCNWAGLILDDQKPSGKVKFNPDNFPGYEHRETHQDAAASNIDTAYTLIFKKVS